MTRLERVTHKLFAENAPVVESGNTSVEIGQFGSALAGTYVATNDVETLQALPAYTRGWGGAVVSENNFPTLEDMNAVQRVQSYQTGYLFQEGIAEYDANSEYGIGSLCKVINGTDVKLYQSLINENIGNPITDTNSWQEFTIGGDLYVKKSGDTMTGSLGVSVANGTPILVTHNNITDSTTTPSSAIYSGIQFNDAKGVRIGKLETSWKTDGTTSFGINAHRIVNGSSKYCQILCSVGTDGNAITSAPTPATNDNSTKIATTAYVNNAAVMKSSLQEAHVVTQTYRNGSSWYRVWSDGFIEQGGTTSATAGSTARTVTLVKAFTSTSYQVSLTGGAGGSSTMYWNHFQCTNKTVSNFTAKAGCTETIVLDWYACGY